MKIEGMFLSSIPLTIPRPAGDRPWETNAILFHDSGQGGRGFEPKGSGSKRSTATVLGS